MKFQVLTDEQARHFVEKGYVTVKGCVEGQNFTTVGSIAGRTSMSISAVAATSSG